MKKIFKKHKVVKIPTKDLENKILIGHTSGKKEVYTNDDMKHLFVCGTTGSGKTVVLSNYIKSSIEKDYPMLILDGKGDIGNDSILDITKKLNTNKKIYIIDLNNPSECNKYNPFKNATATIAKDMLINMTEWSEEHYKLNTERYLQRLVNLLCIADILLSFQAIISYMNVDKFIQLSSGLLKEKKITKEYHIQNVEICKSSGKIAEDAAARFSTIFESELGQIFSDEGIDIYTALQEKAIILFILNPLLYPEISALFGRLILIDSKKAVSKLYTSNINRTFFIFDEINVYASTVFLDLVNKSRSANVTCILATQSLSDLDANCSEAFREQIIENCNNYIVLRQNSSTNAEIWGKTLGTRNTMAVTYQLQQEPLSTKSTGYGSARRVREFIYHPDDIKQLKMGNAIYLSKDTGQNFKIIVNKPF